jgi:hypothetical protein
MIEATVIADTQHPFEASARITTLEVTAPRYLLAEINTHRVLTRSAASSRAIPVSKRIAMVQEHPFIPSVFGKNKPGMQSEEELDPALAEKARDAWVKAMNGALEQARVLDELAVHKQQANRILEPYTYVKAVITATEWDNFYTLRNHADADPEFQTLAAAMLRAYNASKPTAFSYHLPYLKPKESSDMLLKHAFAVSAARCARVSYRLFDGAVSTIDKDLKLCEDLLKAGHMSPFDHPAIADGITMRGAQKFWAQPGKHRQYWGWTPHRVSVEGSKTGRRDSFAPLVL